MPPGGQSLSWDGTDDRGRSVASGVYFCCIEGVGIEEQKKLVLIK
jgi:hypothetical protein